jgi:serine/threonine protein kinase/tetratricopeptide (TPR) repeat protein
MSGSDPSNRSREEALFEAAQQLRPQERKAFLDLACTGDAALRKQLDALFSAEGAADEFFRSGAPALRLNVTKLTSPSTTSQSAGSELLGTQVGPYKPLQKIGEGGCGVVYMAEQEKPVRRRVALKVIKLGMDTKNVIARFEAERQALAMMDHPNIARVLDVGATETGRPYFVMELVRGVKITEYCDQNHLDTQQRLKLFCLICSAIQHAHQKGIIHRDIKPSNILVTMHDGIAVPKVIDFGIAKAIEQRLTDKTLFTAYEQLIGTPAYMSPEQAEMSGLDVDTRSDIYSLGVLLYELLTGRTPFDNKELLKSGMDEMRRTLREREPARPSLRLNTLQGDELTATATHRHAEPLKLISQMRGDLDWIVMRALEKDRTRRYETANALAMDIQRHLHNEPVLARPPSRRYRFQKLVRRNRGVFIATAAVALTLLVGLSTSTWLLIRERAARRRAVVAEQRAVELLQQAELRAKVTQMTLLLSQESYPEIEVLLTETPINRPSVEAATVLRAVGEWHARQGRWKQAASRLTQLLEVNIFDGLDTVTLDYLGCGSVLVELGDQQAYEAFRQGAIARFAGMTHPFADRIVKITLLLPADKATIEKLSPLNEVTLQTFKNDSSQNNEDTFRAAWQCISLALIEYRKGNYLKAEEWSRRCLFYTEYNAPRIATARIILGLSLHQLNSTAAARSEIAKARELTEEKLRNPLDHGSAVHGFWFDWEFARILLREAEPITQ